MKRDEFAGRVLVELAIEPHPWSVIRMTGWMYGESGPRPLTGEPSQGAAFNPLNTTLPLDGSTDYNDVPVQNYATVQDGILATAMTLWDDQLHDYRAIRLALKHRARSFARAVGNSDWGTPAPLVRAGIGAVKNVPSRGQLEIG